MQPRTGFQTVYAPSSAAFSPLAVQPAKRVGIFPQKDGLESCPADEQLKMHGSSPGTNLS